MYEANEILSYAIGLAIGILVVFVVPWVVYKLSVAYVYRKARCKSKPCEMACDCDRDEDNY